MTDLNPPRAGGRIRLSPTGDGGYRTERLPLADPLEGATDEERAFYLASYQGVPLAELLRRLRLAEWNAEYYQREHEAMQEYQKRYPPLYVIQEMDARHKRVRALLDVPRRRTIPKAELEAALNDRVSHDPPANPDPTADRKAS